MIPPAILDSLTRIPMPRLAPAPTPTDTLTVSGQSIPVLSTACLVVGSGAAGLRAAAEISRRGTQVMIATASVYGGTSACSGSDKQTLHTAGTSRRGDDFVKLASDLSAGGCMDLDTAYIESVGSIQTLGGLRYLGLPLPEDRFGAVLRYQTDHDTVGRATSCGPRTSRLMVKVLMEECQRLHIPVLSGWEVIRLLTQDGGIRGCLCMDRENLNKPDRGLRLILAPTVVLATGGPGELFRDSVYPRGCYGSLGLALEAGAAAGNLTEHQFGIGTDRTNFPWNLSGTYAQVIPAVYALDKNGAEVDILKPWFRTTRECASDIFRKGYQWPFHATRMSGFGSSLFDAAIADAVSRGLTPVMDFRRNCLPAADGKAFSLDDLDPDARGYLERSQALQATPIERLRKMNPLAIELYRMHGNDLAAEPLPFRVNHQHMNGGLEVDLWNRCSLQGLYAVGEVAGTHGVTRPGGAALNAGQVGAIRAATHIASVKPQTMPVQTAKVLHEQIAESLGILRQAMTGAGRSIPSVKEEIQARMSEDAGFLCRASGVAPAYEAAIALRKQVYSGGLAVTTAAEAVQLFRWRHLALSSEAVLAALTTYIAHGGGSRGARAVLDPQGEGIVESAKGPVEHLRYRKERPEDRQERIVVEWNGEGMNTTRRPLRGTEALETIWFEKDWAPYLTGEFCTDGFQHG